MHTQIKKVVLFKHNMKPFLLLFKLQCHYKEEIVINLRLGMFYKKPKKTIGNAYTYWATDPNSRLVFVIDGVTLDRKYQNDESIKQNLLRYAYKYAHDVKGDDDFLLYAGAHYNSISMDEYQFKTVPLQILGNTGNRKYYLDSLKNKKYVTIDGENTYLADVREIKI